MAFWMLVRRIRADFVMSSVATNPKLTPATRAEHGLPQSDEVLNVHEAVSRLEHLAHWILGGTGFDHLVCRRPYSWDDGVFELSESLESLSKRARKRSTSSRTDSDGDILAEREGLPLTNLQLAAANLPQGAWGLTKPPTASDLASTQTAGASSRASRLVGEPDELISAADVASAIRSPGFAHGAGREAEVAALPESSALGVVGSPGFGREGLLHRLAQESGGGLEGLSETAAAAIAARLMSGKPTSRRSGGGLSHGGRADWASEASVVGARSNKFAMSEYLSPDKPSYGGCPTGHQAARDGEQAMVDAAGIPWGPYTLGGGTYGTGRAADAWDALGGVAGAGSAGTDMEALSFGIDVVQWSALPTVSLRMAMAPAQLDAEDSMAKSRARSNGRDHRKAHRHSRYGRGRSSRGGGTSSDRDNGNGNDNDDDMYGGQPQARLVGSTGYYRRLRRAVAASLAEAVRVNTIVPFRKNAEVLSRRACGRRIRRGGAVGQGQDRLAGWFTIPELSESFLLRIDELGPSLAPAELLDLARSGTGRGRLGGGARGRRVLDAAGERLARVRAGLQAAMGGGGGAGGLGTAGNDLMGDAAGMDAAGLASIDENMEFILHSADSWLKDSFEADDVPNQPYAIEAVLAAKQADDAVAYAEARQAGEDAGVSREAEMKEEREAVLRRVQRRRLNLWKEKEMIESWLDEEVVPLASSRSQALGAILARLDRLVSAGAESAASEGLVLRPVDAGVSDSAVIFSWFCSYMDEHSREYLGARQRHSHPSPPEPALRAMLSDSEDPFGVAVDAERRQADALTSNAAAAEAVGAMGGASWAGIGASLGLEDAAGWLGGASASASAGVGGDEASGGAPSLVRAFSRRFVRFQPPRNAAEASALLGVGHPVIVLRGAPAGMNAAHNAARRGARGLGSGRRQQAGGGGDGEDMQASVVWPSDSQTTSASSRSSLLTEPGIEVRCLDIMGAIGLFSLLIHLNYHGRLPLIDVTMPAGLAGGIFNPGAPASADEIGNSSALSGEDDSYDARDYDAGPAREDEADRDEDEEAEVAAPTPSRRRTSSTPRKRRQF